MKEWFAAWFDSPFYHQLYKNHDEQEARTAVDNLLGALDLAPDARVLDLACGRGRHARYLAEKGFEVTGIDISSSSIAFARQFENERLMFFQHDMRQPFRINYFDAVANFFTSFGYFEAEDDHLRALSSVARGLKPGGMFLLDYFNSEWVRHHLVRAETKTVEGIEFHLGRAIEGDHVVKTVEFTADGRAYQFRERVRLFSLADFQALFARAGLWLRQLYGGYDLAPFDLQASKRLILIAEKTAARP
jgi:SAM-dependent methyltransferase